MLHIFIEAEFMNQNSTLWFYKFHTCMWNLTKKKLKGPQIIWRKLRDRSNRPISLVVPP